MYAKICYGSLGTFTMKTSVVALTFLMGCLFLKVFGGIFQTLVELFVTPNNSFYFHPTFYILVVFFVMMPLMFKEDITELRVRIFRNIYIEILVYWCCINNNISHKYYYSVYI